MQRYIERLQPKVVILLALLAAAFAFSAIQAQQVNEVNISVSPQAIELTANPGDTDVQNVRITNNSSEPVQILANVSDIVPEGEEGVYQTTEDTTSYSLAQWATISPDSAIIPAGQTLDFALVFDFPPNAEPGGHFATAVFETVPPPGAAEGSSASVQQEINLPVILAKVSGDIFEEGNIESFAATKGFWSNESTIAFEVRFQNTGNVHYRPSGDISIKNMFGSEVANIPITENNVLPDSIRVLSAEWNDIGFQVGQYTADLTLVYGEDDQILTESTSFTIFPYQTIIPLAIIIIVGLYLLIRFRARVWMAIKVLSGKN